MAANLDMFPGVTIDRGQDDDLHNTHCCLVAIARLQITSSTTANDLNANNPNEFISRHAMCGKFTFVDQRVIGVLGYQPVDLLNKSCYDFFHPDDIAHMKENFEQGEPSSELTSKGLITNLMLIFSDKAKGPDVLGDVPVPGEKQGVGVDEDASVRLPESVHGRHRVRRVYQQFGQVSTIPNYV